MLMKYRFIRCNFSKLDFKDEPGSDSKTSFATKLTAVVSKHIDSLTKSFVYGYMRKEQTKF